MRLGYQTIELRQHRWVHAKMLQIETAGFLVEQTPHGAFAVAGRQGRNPHIDRLAADPQGDPAILRQTLFGNIDLCHDLDTLNQRGVHRLLRPHYITQTAVDAEADDRNLLE